VPYVTASAHHALPAVRTLAHAKQDPLPGNPMFPDPVMAILGTSYQGCLAVGPRTPFLSSQQIREPNKGIMNKN
jgi:hypothetical protein